MQRSRGRGQPGDGAGRLSGRRNPDTNQAEAITASNAEASARAYLETSLQGEAPGAVAAMKATYLSKEAELEAVVAAAPIDAAGKAGGALLLQGCFAAIGQ